MDFGPTFVILVNRLFYLDNEDKIRWKIQWGRMKPHDLAGRVYPTAAGKGFKPNDHLIKIYGIFYTSESIKPLLSAKIDSAHVTHECLPGPSRVSGDEDFSKTHTTHTPPGLIPVAITYQGQEYISVSVLQELLDKLNDIGK